MKTIKLALIVQIMFSTSVFSQVIDFDNDKYWISGGIGSYNSTQSEYGFAYSFGVNLSTNTSFYKMKYTNFEEFKPFSGNIVERFHSVGLMAGKEYSWKYFQINLSGGLGVFAGTKRGNLLYTEPSSGDFDISDRNVYEKNNFITPLVPLEIEFILKPMKFCGAGVSLYADLNLKRPMFGIGYKMMLGKLR